MEQKIKAAAVTVIAMIFVFIASFVMTDAVYAADTIKTYTISEEETQSKNIQNKSSGIDIKPFGLSLNGVNDLYTLKTNLEDGFVLRSSKKVFDVWAKYGGFKTQAQAQLFRVNANGEIKELKAIGEAWDDGNKQSFLLDMGDQETGDFLIKVYIGQYGWQAASIIKEYSFTYQKTPKGGYIGDVTVDIEAFTISLGYIEEPVRFPVYQGENAAQVLDRYLKQCGYTYLSTGSLHGGFYLGAIQGIKTDLSKAELEETVATKVNEEDYGWNKEEYTDGSLGEFDFTGQSGWMYSVNNIFPNVGFSDFYLDDGDVMRIQFTVATGRDIGGSGSTGGWNPDFYAVADKSESTAVLADINSALNSKVIREDNTASRLIEQVMEVNQRIGASQDEVDDACDRLNAYLDKNSVSPDLTLNVSEMVMRKNNTQKLEADYGDIQSLKPLHMEWTSDENLIATVDSEGNVTGHRAGTVTISAHLGESVASCQVTIEEVPLQGIRLVAVSSVVWEKYKTENGYRLPTSALFMVKSRPIPEDTTDDFLPVYSIDTKRYATIGTRQDGGNECVVTGKHDGTTLLTATAGEYTAQMEIEFYEDKVASFTCDDPEPVLTINGYDAVKKKQLTFITDPDEAQDKEAMYFASSDPSVFEVGYPAFRDDLGTAKPIKKTIYARGEGVAELYVTIGNITKTFPVQVYDLKESDSFVADSYANISQVYSTEDVWKRINLGGKRYRAGEQYYGDEDKNKFRLSSSDPDLVLGTEGKRMEDGSIAGGHSYESIEYEGVTSWRPWLTGRTGTATITNKMDGKTYMVSKVVVTDNVTPVESIVIKKDGEALEDSGEYDLNEAFTLEASVLPQDATGELVWNTSDPNVATVDQRGNVEIKGYGDADIVACKAGKYAVHAIHVDQPMTGMTISNQTLNLTTDTSRQLMAWCLPNDTTEDQTITWESTDPETVSVTDNGKITTHKEGVAEITARAGRFSVSCEVTVDNQKLRQLYFPKSPVYIEKGETISLGAPKTVPESAYADASEYTWSSSDESYATVDQEGNVTLLKASPADRDGGKPKTREDYDKRVKIYAEKDGVTGECVIQTGAPMTGFEFSVKEVTIYKGDEITIDTIFYPEDTTETRNALKWKSSNDLVVSQRNAVTVSGERLIVGLKVGEATITAEYEDFSASCKVKVVLPPAQQAAYDLQKKIEEWCDLDPVSDRAKYVSIGKEIMEAWETFTPAQKDLVGGYNEYFAEHEEEIRAMAEDDDAAAGAAALIKAIGKVSFDKSCKSRIDAARKAYDALTAAQKKLISADVLKILTDAEKRYGELKEADEKKQEIARKKAAARKFTVSGLKVTSKSRRFTVTWKKNSKASGYQVQYRKKGAKKFTNLKKAVVKVKVKSKKLKKGKKYQFRVRTYTIVEGSKVYGKWTKDKTAKCK